ncbi:MAG: AMP-binding protein [Rhodococcus sp. (in: high G+C Gram-positive bacteria)]|uniref:AMP-binding protein n=1 Tax=Rhodococcus sp. TaxID=1831 RepID=UPI003BAFE7A0
MDVRTLMRRAASTYSGYTAVISGDRQLTFSEAWERGLRMANGLSSLGLQQGDRVAVLEDNCLEAQDFFAGTAAAGLVRVPLYARDSRDAHKHNLDHTQSRVLIVTPKYLDAVRGLENELEHLEHIFVRDDTYEDWLMSQSTNDPDPVIDVDDL